MLKTLDPQQLRGWLHSYAPRLAAYPWRTAPDGFRVRSYRSYEEYIQHQGSKLNAIDFDLERYDREFRSALAETLRANPSVQPPMSVLCLAARIGTEVKAFLDIGCFAVGLDLNPGKNNRYVVVGDFHHLQFAACSVDLIYTNSLDHALYAERLLSEAHRVLKPDGIFILEALAGEEEGGRGAGYYEAFEWQSIDALLDLFQCHGFDLLHQMPISYPWTGRHMTFARAKSYP